MANPSVGLPDERLFAIIADPTTSVVAKQLAEAELQKRQPAPPAPNAALTAGLPASDIPSRSVGQDLGSLITGGNDLPILDQIRQNITTPGFTPPQTPPVNISFEGSEVDRGLTALEARQAGRQGDTAAQGFETGVPATVPGTFPQPGETAALTDGLPPNVPGQTTERRISATDDGRVIEGPRVNIDLTQPEASLPLATGGEELGPLIAPPPRARPDNLIQGGDIPQGDDTIREMQKTSAEILRDPAAAADKLAAAGRVPDPSGSQVQGPVPKNDAEKQELKGVWERFFAQPETQAFLFQMGAALLQGEDTGTALLAGARGARTSRQDQQKEAAARKKGELDERKVAVAERGATTGERQLDASVSAAEKRAEREIRKIKNEEARTQIQRTLANSLAKARASNANKKETDTIVRRVEAAIKFATTETIEGGKGVNIELFNRLAKELDAPQVPTQSASQQSIIRQISATPGAIQKIDGNKKAKENLIAAIGQAEYDKLLAAGGVAK